MEPYKYTTVGEKSSPVIKYQMVVIMVSGGENSKESKSQTFLTSGGNGGGVFDLVNISSTGIMAFTDILRKWLKQTLFKLQEDIFF